jgi:hypothetical protein
MFWDEDEINILETGGRRIKVVYNGIITLNFLE